MRHVTIWLAGIAVLLVGCTADPPPEATASAEAPPAEATEGDEGGYATGSTNGDPDELGGELPPPNPLALDPLYGDALAELGLRITDRGGLIDRKDTYEPSAEGTHLALYLEPTTSWEGEEYLNGIVQTAQIFLDDVFDRWPGLESFDVCLEVDADTRGDAGLLAVTQLEIPRELAAQAARTDLTVSDLLILTADHDEAHLRVFGELERHPTWLEARRDLRRHRGGLGS